jgi:hypothetical protein
MCLHPLLLSLAPLAAEAMLGTFFYADGIFLEVDVHGAGGRRLLLRVRDITRSDAHLRIRVEELAQLVELNGETEIVEPANGDDVDLVAERRGELQIVFLGRLHVAAPVRIGSIGEDGALGFRIVPSCPVDSRPTVPNPRAA